MVQRLYKNWLPVSKLIWGIWTTSDKQWKVQKVEIVLSSVLNFMYFGQKEPIEVKFADFYVVDWKFTKFLMS